jgi:hypothetical protein
MAKSNNRFLSTTMDSYEILLIEPHLANFQYNNDAKSSRELDIIGGA